jgi:hypothetical protein
MIFEDRKEKREKRKEKREKRREKREKRKEERKREKDCYLPVDNITFRLFQKRRSR